VEYGLFQGVPSTGFANAAIVTAETRAPSAMLTVLGSAGGSAYQKQFRIETIGDSNRNHPGAMMTDFARSSIEFQQCFGDEAVALTILPRRWPDGFVSPGCGGSSAWQLVNQEGDFSVRRLRSPSLDHRWTPVMHHLKLPLPGWFWAADLKATQIQYMGDHLIKDSIISG